MPPIDPARALAAEQMLRAPGPEAGLSAEAPPEELPEMAAPDLESALSMVEAAIAEFSPDVQSKIRESVEAIREAASGAEEPVPTEGEEAEPSPVELPSEPPIPRTRE